MTDDKTTEIVKYEPGAPLRDESWLPATVMRDTPECRMLRVALNRAWPGDLDPQRRNNKTIQLLEQATIAIAGAKSPESIRRCCISSVLDSLTTVASLDLSLQKAFGEVYLVPFANVCTALIGYRGFIKLLVNTGFVTHVESVLVYEGEEFTHWRDQDGPHWTHKPDLTLQGQAGQVVGCYAVGYTRKGPPLFEYMNAAELEQVKQASAGVRSGKPTPYTYWPTEMMRKAPTRRMQKYVPKTADNLGYELLAKAVEHDNRLFDLKGYEQAQLEYKAEKQAEKDADWAERMAAEDEIPGTPESEKPEPPAIDPNDPTTWEKAEDGQPIPPNVGQPKESDNV